MRPEFDDKTKTDSLKRRDYSGLIVNGGGMDIADSRPLSRSKPKPKPLPKAVEPRPVPEPMVPDFGNSEAQPYSFKPEDSFKPNKPQRTRKFKFSPINLALNKKLTIKVALAIVLIVVIAGIAVFGLSHKSNTLADAPKLVKNLAKPNFTPIVPKGESQLAHQSSRTSFNSSQDSYTFDDLFLNLPIQVSEQPVPSGYKSITNVVQTVAKNINANETVNFNGGIAYLYSDSSSHKQVMVFSKDNLLIFIQSLNIISPSDWSSYINSLS